MHLCLGITSLLKAMIYMGALVLIHNPLRDEQAHILLCSDL